MSRRPRGREPRDCTACHESPHMPTLVMRVVADEIDRPGGQCAVCHEAEHTGFREAVVEMVPEHHAATGFQLVPPHDRAACADCHLADAPNFERRHPGRSADDCASCHADPHHGQFDRGPFAAEGCLACHDRRHFEPPAFGAEQHGRVDFPLDGSHLELECAACHGEPLHDGPRPFRGTPAKCEECHEDAHLGAFRRFEVRREPPELGRCAQCHLTTSFDEVPDERFVHGDWTAFPLAGAHAQADCEACHLPRPEPDETGRRFGRAGEDVRPVGPTPDSVQAAPMDPGNRRGHAGVKRDFFGDRLMAGEVGCVDCHADPHGGLFDRPTMPREYGGATGCARCHDETSFRVLPEDFDHRLWTGFALQGAHMDAGCDSCHVRRVRPDAEGRTWGRALGTGCADCHQDPHGGQFLASAGQDCDTCHRAASSFADLRFDHDRDSRFKLGQAHSDVGCESCHEAVDVGGTSIVRYKPIDTECIDCHGVHESVLLRRSGRSR